MQRRTSGCSGASEETILCVCHEIPVRYAVNAAAGSESLDAPVHDIANAAPYVFDAARARAGRSLGIRKLSSFAKMGR